jgi:hypothetical protein
VPLILSVTGKPVCGGAGVAGVEAGSGVAGGTPLANGAVVASRPTEPSRDRKARREEEPNPEGASVSSPLFLLISSDIISEFGSAADPKLFPVSKGRQLYFRLLVRSSSRQRGEHLSRWARYGRRGQLLSRFCATCRILAKNGPRMNAKKHLEPLIDADLCR